jgi:pyruvate,water dikinase
VAYFQAFAREIAGCWLGRPRAGWAAPAPLAVNTALGRIYVDITDLLQSPKMRTVMEQRFAWKDPVTGEALRILADRHFGAGPAGRGLPLLLPWRLLLPMLGRALAAIWAPDAARERLLARAEADYRALERQAAKLTGVKARLQFVYGTLARYPPEMLLAQLPPVLVGLVAGQLAEAALGRYLDDRAAVPAVFRSPAHDPTTEMGVALWALSRKLRAAGDEPSADHPGVRDFLARYGHRAVREIDIGVDRWTEDPTYVLGVLRTYMAQPDGTGAGAAFTAGSEAAGAAAASLMPEFRRKAGRLRAAWVRGLIRRFRALAGLRERPKFDLVRVLALGRRVLREAGAELVKASRLDHPDDIFYLTPNDLTPSDPTGDLRAKATAGRVLYQQELGRRAVPRVITSLGESVYGAIGRAPGALTGTPVSPGVYEGTVRVLLHPTDRLEPGEVLVTVSTDPGWTPLFISAGALVMEIGGVMSHGSVVAREYGLPAVAGVADASVRLKTGQRVRVNGETGEVVVLAG